MTGTRLIPMFLERACCQILTLLLTFFVLELCPRTATVILFPVWKKQLMAKVNRGKKESEFLITLSMIFLLLLWGAVSNILICEVIHVLSKTVCTEDSTDCSPEIFNGHQEEAACTPSWAGCTWGTQVIQAGVKTKEMKWIKMKYKTVIRDNNTVFSDK